MSADHLLVDAAPPVLVVVDAEAVRVTEPAGTTVLTLDPVALAVRDGVPELVAIVAEGPPGQPGAGLQITGHVPTAADLPDDLLPADAGTGYLADDTGDLWVWDGTAWVDAGPIRGPTGPAGANGADGADGAAATVTVGTTTTGAPGTNAAVTNSGSSAAAILDFTVPRGAVGATGATGAPGIQGIQGNPGPQGDPGSPGADGADGAAATVAVGTVTTGAPGSAASVTNSGTSSAAVFDIAIPRGDVGATGSTGSAGATGPSGVISVTAPIHNAGTSTAADLSLDPLTDANVATANKDGLAATPSLRTLGSGATQAAPGNDSRLSDSRAPTGAAGGVLSGTYPNPGLADGAVSTTAKLADGVVTSAKIADGTITDTDMAAANKDGTAGTPSLRTLGTGAQQATAGNDARLSDARTPTAHASTHNAGGSDVLAIDAAAGTGSLRTLGTGATSAAAGNDARLSDARTPTAHASTHDAGGSDPMATNAAAATPSLRSLGTTATTAAAGNDARLSDSRAPNGTAGGDLGGTFPNPTVLKATILTTLGDLVYQGASALARLAGNTTATRQFLVSQGSAGAATAPTLDTLQAGDLPAATTSAAGSLSAADKTKLDAATNAATASTLVLRDGSGDAAFHRLSASAGYAGILLADLPTLTGTALNYDSTGSNIENGTTYPTSPVTLVGWQNVGPSQSFSSAGTGFIYEITLSGFGFFVNNSTAEYGSRILLDGATTLAAGGNASASGIGGNIFAGSAAYYVTGLSVGSHTLQAQMSSSQGGLLYIRGSLEWMRITVREFRK